MKRKDEKKSIIENLFLHSKPVKMLLSLKSATPKYTTQVSKAVDCTYSHTVKVLEFFKRLGLVVFEKKGRIKRIKLTPEGEELAIGFEGITRRFSRLSSQIKDEILPKKEKEKKKGKK